MGCRALLLKELPDTQAAPACRSVPEEHFSLILQSQRAQEKPDFSGTLPICYCLPMEWIVQAVTNSSHFSKALSVLGEAGYRRSPAPFPWALAALLQPREIWKTNHSCRHPVTVPAQYSCMQANQLLQFFHESLVYRQSNPTHYIVCLLTLCCHNWNKDIQIKILRKMRCQKIKWKILT